MTASPKDLLDLAFPVDDERDKTLRLWTVEDFHSAASSGLVDHEMAQQCVDRMRAAAVERFGDLA